MPALGAIPFDVGDVIGGRYRLEALIGQGGTGVVIAATDTVRDTRVAIKFLKPALANEEMCLRFDREARAITRIESDHVVVVLDVGVAEVPYMVMEYLEGRDLACVLREDGPLPIERAVDCMVQVCEVLAKAHAAGIIHRDLKPANLFLTKRGNDVPHVKVVDFGISKILDHSLLGRSAKEMTGAFDVLGSPRYMAPEQLRDSKGVDGRADLFSIGAVLFKLITGAHAFGGDSNVAAGVAILAQEPATLRSVIPDAPEALEAVVARCLTKDPAARYQTAGALAEALVPFASVFTKKSFPPRSAS